MSKIFRRNFNNDGISSTCFMILDNGNLTFECMLPNGRYIIREFAPNHKLIESIEWQLRKIEH